MTAHEKLNEALEKSLIQVLGLKSREDLEAFADQLEKERKEEFLNLLKEAREKRESTNEPIRESKWSERLKEAQEFAKTHSKESVDEWYVYIGRKNKIICLTQVEKPLWITRVLGALVGIHYHHEQH